MIERGVILGSDNGPVDSSHLFTSGERFDEKRFEVGREGRLIVSDPAALVSDPEPDRELDRVSRGVSNLLLGEGDDCGNVSLDEVETLLLKRALARANGNVVTPPACLASLGRKWSIA